MGGGGLCGGLLMGFHAFWFSCTTSSDCRLEMNCPFEFLSLGDLLMGFCNFWFSSI